MGEGAGDAGRPTTDVRDGGPGVLPTRGPDRGRAVPSPTGARADWEIVALLGAALGRADLFPYDGPAAIWEEIRRVWPGPCYEALSIL